MALDDIFGKGQGKGILPIILIGIIIFLILKK